MKGLVVAGLGVALALAWVGCRGDRVRFLEACPVYSEPTKGATQVGSIVAGSPYEVRRRDGKWMQIRVKSNRSIGWTDCPIQR